MHERAAGLPSSAEASNSPPRGGFASRRGKAGSQQATCRLSALSFLRTKLLRLSGAPYGQHWRRHSPPSTSVVVDDGSSDDLASALLPYSNHVRLLTSPHVGASGARNLGVEHATGDFVGFLDADDELDPEFLAALGTLSTARPDLEILTSDARIVRDGRPDGTFKTHLAIGLAIRGCQAGHRVLFATASQWVDRLADAHSSGRLQAELLRLSRYPLLVVDEVCYIPFEPEAANLFFQLVSSRYERASLIVTSNKRLGAGAKSSATKSSPPP
jgi:hypothetical protein